MSIKYKKGFISSFFLLVLINVSAVCAVLFYKIECDFEAIDNMLEVNGRLEKEIEIINFIKCSLLNNNLKNGEYYINNESYKLEYDENTVIVSDNSGNSIYIFLRNGKITDYIYKFK